MLKDVFKKWWKEEFDKREEASIRASKLRYYEESLYLNRYQDQRCGTKKKERTSHDVIDVMSGIERSVKDLKRELENTYKEVEAMKDFLNIHYVPKHKDCVDVPAKMVKSHARKIPFCR